METEEVFYAKIKELNDSREAQITSIKDQLKAKCRNPQPLEDLEETILLLFDINSIDNEITELGKVDIINKEYEALKNKIIKVSLSKITRDQELSSLRAEIFKNFEQARIEALTDTSLYVDSLVEIFINPLETLPALGGNYSAAATEDICNNLIILPEITEHTL